MWSARWLCRAAPGFQRSKKINSEEDPREFCGYPAFGNGAGTSCGLCDVCRRSAEHGRTGRGYLEPDTCAAGADATAFWWLRRTTHRSRCADHLAVSDHIG